MDLNHFLNDGKDTPWVSVSLERTGPCNLHAGIVYRQANHVAGACLEDALPVRYPECEANGLRIVAKMDELAPFTPIA